MPLFCILLCYALGGAALWYLFFRLSAKAHIRKAEARGKQPNLAPLRIFYLTTGIIGQINFWIWMYLFSQWKGFP